MNTGIVITFIICGTLIALALIGNNDNNKGSK